MAILKYIYPIALSIVLTGCYENFTPDVDTKPVLCLNSLITAGQPIEVSVTHSWFYTDETGAADRQVKDAKVNIYVNGELVGDDYLPQDGDIIKIIAESQTFGSAEAEVTVPVSIPIESLEWEAAVTGKEDWNYTDETVYYYPMVLRARMTISDPAESENYFQFTYDTNPDDDEIDPDTPFIDSPVMFYPGTLYYEAEPIFSEHIGLIDAISGNDTYGFSFFTDRRFSGGSYTLNLQFNDMGLRILYPEQLRNENIDDLLNFKIILTLNVISPSYYNWCCYQWNISNGTIGDLGNIGLSDPIWGYSNVSSGAGVVAARSQTSLTIDLKEFLLNEIKLSTK